MRTLLALLCLSILPAAASGASATAVFAGGCFWCMEEAFEKIDGVETVVSGYAGGSAEDADYRKVAAGRTAHAEVIQVRYDPEQVSYENLLQSFWANIDPTTANRQFCDSGSQYRSSIFYDGEAQERLARRSLELVRAQKPFDARIVTLLEPLEAFYAAEDYHQDYYRTNALRYRSYKYACGRQQRLESLWDGEPAFRWAEDGAG